MAGQKGRSGGQNRKPTAQLKETGGYRATRHKKRADVLVIPCRVEPPSILGTVGKEAWIRYVNNLPEALITNLDTDGLTQFCQALELYPKVWQQSPRLGGESRAAPCHSLCMKNNGHHGGATYPKG